MTTRKVFYLSHATPEMYDIIRQELPEGFELVTLEADCDDERRAKLRDANVVITAATPLTGDFIAAAEALDLVHHQGVGYHDTVDIEALARRGVPLALTPAGTTLGVAEHTVLLMLAVLKRLPFADAELRRGHWHINSLRPSSRELSGRTVGYVGLGRIGQAVAERLVGFGTRGIYTDDAVTLSADHAERLRIEKRATLKEVLAEAEIVTLHLPLAPATRHLIDAEAIAHMPCGGVLINTARGPLVDETALAEALRNGHLGGAGLDVFETEPPDADNPILDLPNVVLTPHISAGTRDALRTKMATLFANVARFYRGDPLDHEVPLGATISAQVSS